MDFDLTAKPIRIAAREIAINVSCFHLDITPRLVHA